MSNSAYETEKFIDDLVKTHVRNAMLGTWMGDSGFSSYFRRCRMHNPFRGITSIFTRDVGYHTSGWWKNPDFERCFHLSLSFFEPMTDRPAVFDDVPASLIVRRFFSPYVKLVWHESPFSDSGKKMGVHHYRLFCDEAWQPIKPRGEVYSRELTEAGWCSFSDRAQLNQV